MPELCRFYGIVIVMFFNDHPPPHFHVKYGEYRAKVAIDGFQLIAGRLPPRILGMVVEWAALRQTDLMNAWDAIRRGQCPDPIAPLD